MCKGLLTLIQRKRDFGITYWIQWRALLFWMVQAMVCPTSTCPQSNAQNKTTAEASSFNVDDKGCEFFFRIPKNVLVFGQHCYWPAPPPNLPLMPLLIFGCQGVLHSSRVVREDGNEEGRLTGRTRFRSGGIGWRICPIGRLQQRQEHWSILLQNSHWGLMSPRRKAAFPSETEREKRGGEERRTCGGRDGMMEGWRFRKKIIKWNAKERSSHAKKIDWEVQNRKIKANVGHGVRVRGRKRNLRWREIGRAVMEE